MYNWFNGKFPGFGTHLKRQVAPIYNSPEYIKGVGRHVSADLNQAAGDKRPWYMRKFPAATAVAAPQINIARANFGRWYDGLKTGVKTRYEGELRDTHNRIEFMKGVGRRVFADLNQAAGLAVYGLGLMVPAAAYQHITHGSKKYPEGDYRAFDWAHKTFQDHYDSWERWGNKPGNYMGYTPEQAEAVDNTRPIAAFATNLLTTVSAPKAIAGAAAKYGLPKMFTNAKNINTLLNWDEKISVPGIAFHWLKNRYHDQK